MIFNLKGDVIHNYTSPQDEGTIAELCFHMGKLICSAESLTLEEAVSEFKEGFTDQLNRKQHD